MKVVYDITSLGDGHFRPRGRAGIFRVVESLANGLIHVDECELWFWSNRSFVQMEQAVRYLKANDRFKKAKFVYTDSRILNSVVKAYTRVFPKNDASSPFKMLNAVTRRHPGILARNLSFADIFHSTFFPLPETGKRQKPKRVITVYDLIPMLFPQFFLEGKGVHYRTHEHILNSIGPEDIVICISHSTKNDLCDYTGMDPSRVCVTHLAASDLFYPCADSERIAFTKKKYQIPDSPYLLSLCTLEPRKNTRSVIRAFANLIQQREIGDLNLVLAGTKGWDFKEIFDESTAFPGLEDRIVFTGYVADQDLAALYSGALAFVYPSAYEGFGLPPLEAMQCGVPVITSNTSSLPEVVGDAGITVEPNDTEALSQAMLEVYKNPSTREGMASRSLERAGLFTWEKCARETVGAYRRALED